MSKIKDKINVDEFADAVALALLDHVLWQHLPQEENNEK